MQLRDLRLNDLRSLLEGDPGAKHAMQKSLEELGVHRTLNSMSDLTAAVEQAEEQGYRVLTLFSSIFSRKNFHWLSVALLLVALIGIAGVARLAEYLLSVDPAVTRSLASVVATISVVAAAIKKGSATLNANLKAVQEAKSRVDNLIKSKRDVTTAEEGELAGEIAALGAKEKLAASQLADASARVADIEQRIQTITEEGSLEKFLSQRSRTDDYRKHLGLISIIRRDLSDLKERLSRAGSDGDRKIERVILYIDDLDRCASTKVMEVLQAVHLLLAFDLFVVVVGVDPRWLLHALREEFPAFAKHDRDKSPEEKSWQATPQNYLEKIFQIPYCLPRMTPDGFGKMVIYELAPTGNKESAAAVGGQTVTSQPVVAPVAPPQGQQVTAVNTPSAVQPISAPPPVNVVSPEPVEVIPEALALRSWETKFAEQRLAALISTPRAVKRFANTYRILKASVAPTRLLEYEGTEQSPGDFQVPMTLLAALIGAPNDCIWLFPQLLQVAQAKQDIRVFLNQDPKVLAGAHSTVTWTRLSTIISDPSFPSTPELFAEWLPQVARFSFEVGRSLLSSADTESDRPSPYVA